MNKHYVITNIVIDLSNVKFGLAIQKIISKLTIYLKNEYSFKIYYKGEGGHFNLE
jgi:hypothetical protein